MRKRFYIFAYLLAGLAGAGAQPGIHNLQGIPTPLLWQAGLGSSFDKLDHYTAGQFLNGLNGLDAATLGAFFSRPYVARQAYFGVLVDDRLTSYTPSASLNGLSGGDNWSTLYVVRHPWVPAYAYDDLTSYSVSASLDGLNGGADDGGSVAWAGAYVVDPCTPSGPGPTIASYKGAIVLTTTIPGSMYLTVDGSTPDPSASQGDINAASSWPPSGTFIYAGAFTIAGGGTVTLKTVLGKGACSSTVVSGSYFDIGNNWSNNVRLNGGATVSSANVAIVNNCGLQFNTNGLLEASLGAYPTIVSFNLYMPDNLIAATTPQIYWKGNQPWTSHNFVGGDLTVNGLKGDASSKYLETGVNPSTDLGINSSALAVYAYAVTAGSGSTFDLAAYAGAGPYGTIVNSKRGSSGNAQGQVQAIDAHGILVASPGAGYYCASRTSSSRADLYFANSGNAHASIGNDTAAAASNPNTQIGAFCLYTDFSGPILFSDSRQSAAAIMADGYSSANSAKLYAVLQSVRTQLGGGFQ